MESPLELPPLRQPYSSKHDDSRDEQLENCTTFSSLSEDTAGKLMTPQATPTRAPVAKKPGKISKGSFLAEAKRRTLQENGRCHGNNVVDKSFQSGAMSGFSGVSGISHVSGTSGESHLTGHLSKGDFFLLAADRFASEPGAISPMRAIASRRPNKLLGRHLHAAPSYPSYHPIDDKGEEKKQDSTPPKIHTDLGEVPPQAPTVPIYHAQQAQPLLESSKSSWLDSMEPNHQHPSFPVPIVRRNSQLNIPTSPVDFQLPKPIPSGNPIIRTDSDSTDVYFDDESITPKPFNIPQQDPSPPQVLDEPIATASTADESSSRSNSSDPEYVTHQVLPVEQYRTPPVQAQASTHMQFYRQKLTGFFADEPHSQEERTSLMGGKQSNTSSNCLGEDDQVTNAGNDSSPPKSSNNQGLAMLTAAGAGAAAGGTTAVIAGNARKVHLDDDDGSEDSYNPAAGEASQNSLQSQNSSLSSSKKVNSTAERYQKLEHEAKREAPAPPPVSFGTAWGSRDDDDDDSYDPKPSQVNQNSASVNGSQNSLSGSVRSRQERYEKLEQQAKKAAISPTPMIKSMSGWSVDSYDPDALESEMSWVADATPPPKTSNVDSFKANKSPTSDDDDVSQDSYNPNGESVEAALDIENSPNQDNSRSKKKKKKISGKSKLSKTKRENRQRRVMACRLCLACLLMIGLACVAVGAYLLFGSQANVAPTTSSPTSPEPVVTSAPKPGPDLSPQQPTTSDVDPSPAPSFLSSSASPPPSDTIETEPPASNPTIPESLETLTPTAGPSFSPTTHSPTTTPTTLEPSFAPTASPTTLRPSTGLPTTLRPSSLPTLAPSVLDATTEEPTLAATTISPTVVDSVFVPPTAVPTIPTPTTETESPAAPGVASPVPTMEDFVILASLPEETWQFIRENPGSPQANSFRWMVDDPYIQTYPQWQQEQRFALVTTYYAWFDLTAAGIVSVAAAEGATSAGGGLGVGSDGPVGGADGGEGTDDANDDAAADKNKDDIEVVEGVGKMDNGRRLGYHYRKLRGKRFLQDRSQGNWLDYESPECNWYYTAKNITNQSLWAVPVESTSASQRDIATPSCSQKNIFERLSTPRIEEPNPGTATDLYMTTLPPEIAMLTDLTQIHMPNNKVPVTLESFLPETMTQLSQLRHLDFSQSAIGEWSPMSIRRLPKSLEVLDLSYNKMTGEIFTELGRLRASLTELQLDGNSLEGSIPTAIRTWTRLRNFQVSDNALTGFLPSEIGLLSSDLEVIRLSSNLLEGSIPSQIGTLTLLRSLDLDANNFEEYIPTEVGMLSSLVYFGLADNYLRGSVPTEIGLLTLLDSILISNNKLTGQLPSEIGRLGTLTNVQMHGNNLTGSLPKQLGALSNNLFSIDLHDNSLTGTLFTEIGNLRSTNFLYLYENAFTGTIPTEMGLMGNISYIGLESNMLEGSIPSELGTLKEVRYLNLSNNRLTSSIPTELGNLPWLKYLFLGRNKLFGKIPSELGLVTDLRYLDLGGGNDKLSGTIPSELCALSDLTIRVRCSKVECDCGCECV